MIKTQMGVIGGSGNNVSDNYTISPACSGSLT